MCSIVGHICLPYLNFDFSGEKQMYTYTIEELENLYEQHLTDTYGDIDLCESVYDAGALLRAIDPTAFERGLETYLDVTGFKCVIHGDEISYTLFT